MTSGWRADREVATGLAERLWSASWTAYELGEVVGRSLGTRELWVGALVEEILVLFPGRRPEQLAELADVVAHSEVFVEAGLLARQRGLPFRLVDAPAAAADQAAVSRGWPVPRLRDERELAAWLELSLGQLLWLGDACGYQVRAGPGLFHAYDYRWTARAGRVPRLLEAPQPILKRVQGELLHRLLSAIPVHPAAHGFVVGRSVRTHARQHLGADQLVTVDLRHFFADVGRHRVLGLLRMAGYPEPVARAVTNLCSTRTPEHVLRRMPSGGSSDDRYRLRTRLRSAHLPQGAPTSPVLANLVCFMLDQRLTGYAGSVGATYTRYADDLTLSGGAEFRLTPSSAVLRGLSRIVTAEGFSINPAKTRVRTRAERQLVTGVVVNERPNVPRPQYDRLRAVLHEARTRGPRAANREGHPDFRSHLTGRVEWVSSLNPARGRRLRADLDAIEWESADPAGAAN